MNLTLQFAIVATVVAFAALQSVFGVGLLVFGTPTLLLLGLPFEQVLGYLLPCSILISALQVRSGGGLTLEPIRRRFLLLTAPAVLAGTSFILLAGKVNIRPVVGVMLVVTAGLRLLDPVREAASAFVRRHLSPLLAALGIIHGLSNLGGGILSLIVSSVYEDKESIRKHIAFGYGLMAGIQLTVLFATTRVHLTWALWAALPLAAGLTYWFVGQRLFASTKQTVYHWALTALIAGFGVLLLFPT